MADWRSAANYALLARGDRHAFAWEWLRRSPTYASACDLQDSPPGAFGLCDWTALDLTVPNARPIWTAEADPFVVRGVVRPAEGRDCFDFAALAPIASLCLGADGTEHWLWSDGLRHVRLDVEGGSLRNGPVCLDYRVAGLVSAQPKITALGRLIALARAGRFVRQLFVPERRAARWALILRAHDAIAAGAGQREIAQHLLGLETGRRWRVEASSHRQRAQRLVSAAREAAQIDPREWLRGTYP